MLRQSSSRDPKDRIYTALSKRATESVWTALDLSPLATVLPRRWDLWHPQAGPTLSAGAAEGLGLCLGSPAAALGRWDGSLKLESNAFDLKWIWSGVGCACPPPCSLPGALSLAGLPLPPALPASQSGLGLFQ